MSPWTLPTALLASDRFRLAVLTGLADANGDPSDPLDSIESFFDDGESFKHLEVGWYDTWETRVENNVHLTPWLLISL